MNHRENEDLEGFEGPDQQFPRESNKSPSDPDATSEELLDAVRRGDPDAWSVFARVYVPFARRQCRKAGLDAHDCEDVCQEVLTSVHRSLRRFANDGNAASFRRWLCTIVDRRIADFLRKRIGLWQAAGGSGHRPEPSLRPDFPDLTSATDSSRGNGTQRLFEVSERVRQQVSPTTWKAFWLTTVDGLTSTEAAAVLEMTANAVRLARARVIRLFRSAWDPGDDTPGAAMPVGV